MPASHTTSCTMVAEAAAQIVSQKLDILLSHPVCVECSLMQARAEDAKAKLARIQKFLSTQYRPSKTPEWWGRLLQAMYSAEELIAKFHLREARERHEALHMATWPLAALISKFKLLRGLSKLVKKLEELSDEKFLKEEAKGKGKKEPASSSSLGSSPWQGKKLARLTSFWDRYEPIFFLCLKNKKGEILKRMKQTNKVIQCTSIYGGRGAGKTILARWVYSQAKYMDYEGRAWVRVLPGMDKREFLSKILKQVKQKAREMKDMEIKEIQKMLRKKLAKTKSFLIVLDDVKLPDEPLLRELGMILPFDSPGHIITTTEDNRIAWIMNTFKAGPIMLERLDDEESQAMLAWELHRVPNGQSLSKEEKDILNVCPRVPLHISLLGGILSNAGEHERAALAEGSIDVLQLSCHILPVHLKPCVIYLALFPVGSPIPTRRLVRLWLAEGLLDSYWYDIESERKMLPEDVGETFILELAERNVIHVVSWRADGSPKACQMHTPLYDMICPSAMSTGFLHIHATSKSKDGNDRDPTSQQQQLLAQSRERNRILWLAEHTNIVLDTRGGNYPDLNLGHICSFLSFYLRRGMVTKDINTFLRKITSQTNYSLLRVLDLEGVYKPNLQGVLHKLVLLRYLGLRFTVLDSIPRDVADLHHLETLDIKHTNITSLPSSLWKSRNLRHLHLNWFYIDLKNILEACSNNVNALTQLQTLSGLVIGEVKEKLMRDHMNSLTTLTTLKLFLQQSDKGTSDAAGKAVAHWISLGLTKLQSLTFGVIQEAKPIEEGEPAGGTEPAERASKEAPPPKVNKPAEDATKEAERGEGAIQEAKPIEEGEPAGGAEPAERASKEAPPPKESKPAEDATKEAKRGEVAETTKETTKASQPPKKDEPAKEATKKAKPAKSQIGRLPELSLAEQHHELLELYLLGQLNKPNWTQLLPGSLRVLTLSGSKVEEDMMPLLGNLLKNLRTLRLLANSFLGTRMSFVKDGFPSLKILKIWKLPDLQEVIIETGAMIQLKELEFRHLDKMRKVTGIKECKELENIDVVFKKVSQGFVDDLMKDIGKEKNVYKIEENEMPESMDDDEADRLAKGEMPS